MCRQGTYRVGEPVRVIHVLEVVTPGEEIYVMGPKAVGGEIVDGQKVTPANHGDHEPYDGRVLPSPGVDYNYEITSHTFAEPGRHTIQWRLGALTSNALVVEILPA
jgi:hypothetical protein